jgi:hypothetical protein
MGTHKSKLSFQYGLSVLFETVVVLVCSPLMVATAKGSGNPVRWQSAHDNWLDGDERGNPLNTSRL